MSLRRAMEFPTQEALDTYLKEHPGADKSKHAVSKEEHTPSEEEEDAFGNLHAKVVKFFDGVKGAAKEKVDKARKVINEAPKQVRAFVTDPEFRKKAIDHGVKEAKAAPGKFGKHIWDTFKDEAREKKQGLKHAGRILTGQVKYKYLDDQAKADLKATMFDLVTTTVLFCASGGLAGVTKTPLTVVGKALTTVGKDFTMGMGMGASTKVFSETVDELSKLGDGVKAGGAVLRGLKNIGKLVLKGIMKVGSEEDGEMSDEEAEQLFAAIVISKTLDHVGEHGITDDDVLGGLGLQSKSEKSKEGSLREQVIRLAYQKPALRPVLLPLIPNQRSQ